MPIEAQVSFTSITALLFCAGAIFTVWYLTSRCAGVVSWGGLVPLYFMGVLVVHPMLLLLLENKLPGGNYLLTDTDISILYVYSGLGLIFFGVGYVILGAGVGNVWKHILKRLAFINRTAHIAEVTLTQLWPLFVVLIIAIGGIVYSLIEGYFGLYAQDNVGAVAGVASIASQFLIYLQIILVARWLAVDDAGKVRWLAIIVTLLILAVGLISNSKQKILLPFLTFGLAYYFTKKVVPIKLIIVVVTVFIFFAYPLVTGFRYSIYFAATGSQVQEIVRNFIEYFISGDWVGIQERTDVYGIGTPLEQIGRGIFGYLAHIFRTTGVTIDYLYGKTFVDGLLSFTPRFLYPEKPDLNIGNWTGQMYGVVSNSDSVTSVSPTTMGEFYMNFGLLGLFVGMCLVGVVAFVVDSVVFKSDTIWVKVLMAVSLVMWLESFFGQSVLPFVKSIILFALTVLVLNWFHRAVLSLKYSNM